MKPSTLTPSQYISGLLRSDFEEYMNDFPEQAGAIIDHCYAAGFKKLATDLICDWEDSAGYSIYEAYLRGNFNHTEEYKAAKERDPNDEDDEIVDPGYPGDDVQPGQKDPRYVVKVVEPESAREMVNNFLGMLHGLQRPVKKTAEQLKQEVYDKYYTEKELEAVVASSPQSSPERLRYSAKTAIAEKVEEERAKLEKIKAENLETYQQVTGARKAS